jgi:hypothetical protein
MNRCLIYRITNNYIPEDMTILRNDINLFTSCKMATVLCPRMHSSLNHSTVQGAWELRQPWNCSKERIYRQKWLSASVWLLHPLPWSQLWSVKIKLSVHNGTNKKTEQKYIWHSNKDLVAGGFYFDRSSVLSLKSIFCQIFTDYRICVQTTYRIIRQNHFWGCIRFWVDIFTEENTSVQRDLRYGPFSYHVENT